MQDFMATPSGFSMALNSVYANVRSTYSAEEGIHGLMNPGTDELKNNIGGSNRCADLANYDLENIMQTMNIHESYGTMLIFTSTL